MVAPNLLQYLPNAALAAVVIAAAIGLIEIGDLKRIYRIQRWEFWLTVVCFVGVAVFGAIPGIALAIAIAILEFLWDGWRPHSAVLGRARGVRGYHDLKRYPDARLIPGLVLFRWDAPLFFANAEFFRERILAAIEASPTQVRWLVVAAEPVTSVDVTACDAVAELEPAAAGGHESAEEGPGLAIVAQNLARAGVGNTAVRNVEVAVRTVLDIRGCAESLTDD